MAVRIKGKALRTVPCTQWTLNAYCFFDRTHPPKYCLMDSAALSCVRGTRSLLVSGTLCVLLNWCWNAHKLRTLSTDLNTWQNPQFAFLRYSRCIVLLSFYGWNCLFLVFGQQVLSILRIRKIFIQWGRQNNGLHQNVYVPLILWK